MDKNYKVYRKKMLCYLLMPVARFVLWVAGWKPLSTQQQQQFKRYPKAVYVYPHTSAWDFVWGLVYKCAHPKIFADAWMVMKPQPFEKWYGWWLPWAGFIPATRREERGRGFVKKALTILNPYPRSHVIISPEGTRKASSWRSGYYYLARGMESQKCDSRCLLAVFGLDYEHYKIVLYPHHDLDEFKTYKEMEKCLQSEMENIVPLYPENSPIPVRKHYQTHILNWNRLFQGFI